MRAAHLLEQREAVPAGQVEVDERDVPALCVHQIQRLGGAARLTEAGAGKCLGEDLDEPTADDGVIVDEQDSHHELALEASS